MLEIFKSIFEKKEEVNYSELVKNGAVVLDVRTAGEFADGHIKNAVNISVGELPKNLSKLKNKNTPVITCCASGMRSETARNILKANGYKEVYNGGSWRGLEGKL